MTLGFSPNLKFTTHFWPHVFVFTDPCTHCILPGRLFLGLKTSLWNVNLKLPHAAGSHCSVKVLTVQVVIWNLLQWRHFQHYSDHEHTGFWLVWRVIWIQVSHLRCLWMSSYHVTPFIDCLYHRTGNSTTELEIWPHKCLFWVHIHSHSRVPFSSAHAKVHLVQIVK